MPRPKNYFAHIDQHFLKNIYQSAKGAIRLYHLQQSLKPLLQGSTKNILDIGAGAGQMALYCAKLGHHITLIDQSAPLLHEAQKNAKKENLEHRLTFIENDLFKALHALEDKKYDLILCHAVLEWIEDGEALLKHCAMRMAPNSHLSLLFYNRAALYFTQHVFGNFEYIANNLKAKKRAKLTPDYPRERLWTIAECEKQNLELDKEYGVRIFYDYMKEKDRKNNTLEDIIHYEYLLSQNPQYLNVARYIHQIYRPKNI